MKSMFRKTQGRYGEEYAVAHLEKLGHTIVERNFLIRGGEIDIISIDTEPDGQKVLVFTEVKTRSSDAYGTPLEAISYHKLKTLIKSAHIYKASHRGLPALMRIDAIAVQVTESGQLIDIELVKNIS